MLNGSADEFIVRRSSKSTSRMLGRIATSRRRRACCYEALEAAPVLVLGWGLLCRTPHGRICGGPVAAFVARRLPQTSSQQVLDTDDLMLRSNLRNELVC